jgi:hypothetical protein
MAADETNGSPKEDLVAAAETGDPKQEPAEEEGKASATDQEQEAAPDEAVAARTASQPAEAADEEGWPRSWIIVTAVLGIIAIIVVARLAGRSWRAEEGAGPPPPMAREEPPPPEPRPAAPGSGAEKALLDISNVQLAKGRHCLGKDGKPHPFKSGSDAPETCMLPTEGAAFFRAEFGNLEPPQELPVWIMRTAKEAPPLMHAMLLPFPRETAAWFSSNFTMGQALVLVVDAAGPFKITRVRFLVGK